MFKSACKFFVLSLILFFSGCSSEKNKGKSLTLLLDWLPNPNHVPLYFAKEAGIFQKHGIDLRLIKLYDPNDTLPYLQTGQADVAIYYMPQTIRALSQGSDIKILGSLISEPLDGFMMKAEEEKPSFASMKEKVLANFLTVLDRKLLNVFAKNHALDFKEVRQIHFDPAGALKAELVDVVSGICWNIEQAQLEEEGFPTHVFKFSDLDIPRYHELVFIGNKDFCQKYPEVVKELQEAFQEALDASRQDPQNAFEAYIRANPDKSESTVRWEQKAWDLTVPLLSIDSYPDTEIWDEMTTWLKEEGVIEKDDEIEYDDIIL